MSEKAEPTLSNLLKALQIALSYEDVLYPTHCEHDVLLLLLDPAIVSDEDKGELARLGFISGEGEDEGCFMSFRYGSA